jgi:hypothetical protein
VEPNYEKNLKTLEGLLDSDLIYGYHSFLSYAQDTVFYPEFVKFVEHKEQKDEFVEGRVC